MTNLNSQACGVNSRCAAVGADWDSSMLKSNTRFDNLVKLPGSFLVVGNCSRAGHID